MERHRVLQQGLRQPVLQAERGREPGAAAAGGLPDAADDRLRPAVPGDRLPGLDRGAEYPLEPSARGGRRLVQLDVNDPHGQRAQAVTVRGADYLVKRGFFALVTIYVAITINFFLFRVLPGNAITDLSRVPHASPALRHALLVEFGLDKPKWQQYLIYLDNLAHGNMGISFANQRPVSHLLLADVKNTIPMVTVGTVAAFGLGVFTGVLSAWRRGAASDHVSTNLAISAYAFPTQWLALMVLSLFSGTLPAAGMSDPFLFTAESFWPHLADIGKHMI